MQKYPATSGKSVTYMCGCTNLTVNLITFLFGGWNFTTPTLTLKRNRSKEFLPLLFPDLADVLCKNSGDTF